MALASAPSTWWRRCPSRTPPSRQGQARPEEKGRCSPRPSKVQARKKGWEGCGGPRRGRTCGPTPRPICPSRTASGPPTARLPRREVSPLPRTPLAPPLPTNTAFSSPQITSKMMTKTMMGCCLESNRGRQGLPRSAMPARPLVGLLRPGLRPGAWTGLACRRRKRTLLGSKAPQSSPTWGPSFRSASTLFRRCESGALGTGRPFSSAISQRLLPWRTQPAAKTGPSHLPLQTPFEAPGFESLGHLLRDFAFARCVVKARSWVKPVHGSKPGCC
mmetsp:Transcript_10682/g.24957  ORF Transcript_10682/g.24957 Transcript_10682/m.24957 type:complete len:274 (+) Transcript_10682:2177-2998(+)